MEQRLVGDGEISLIHLVVRHVRCGELYITHDMEQIIIDTALAIQGGTQAMVDIPSSCNWCEMFKAKGLIID